MKIECYIDKLIVVVFNDMITVRIEDNLLFATLLDQVDDAYGIVSVQLVFKMFLEGNLSFGSLCKINLNINLI